MKALFFSLLALNIVAGLWLLTNGPADTLREPGRFDRQVVPEQFKALSDADVAALRAQAEKAALAAPAPVPAAPAAPAPAPPTPPAAAELPLVDCVLIVNFKSDVIATKLRARMGEIRLSESQVALEPDRQKFRLRISGISALAENHLHEMLKDYPSLQLEHCLGSAPR
jgi:hypothetical protein